jgi:hypothetical protein
MPGHNRGRSRSTSTGAFARRRHFAPRPPVRGSDAGKMAPHAMAYARAHCHLRHRRGRSPSPARGGRRHARRRGAASGVDRVALADAVSDVVGKPLPSIPDLDFRVPIAKTAPYHWRLRLETIDRSSADAGAAAVRGSGDIEAASCAERADAVSVAIAVSIRTIAAAPKDPPGPPHPRGQKRGRPPPPPVARSTPPPPAKPPWRAGTGLAVVAERGVLPRVAPGVELEGPTSARRPPPRAAGGLVRVAGHRRRQQLGRQLSAGVWCRITSAAASANDNGTTESIRRPASMSRNCRFRRGKPGPRDIRHEARADATAGVTPAEAIRGTAG